MKKYQTLKQEIYDLDALPPDQQSMYEVVWDFYQQEPDWDTFTAFWLAQGNYPGRLRGPMQSAFTAFLRKG